MKCRHWDKNEIPSFGLGDEPQCAFNKKGHFVNDNWNCKALRELRSEALNNEQSNNDQTYALFPYDDSGKMVLLSYYKHRGETMGFWIVDNGYCIPGTENEALDWKKVKR